MLEIRNLYKHFGPLVAVDDVSFTVSRGEVLGFLGPNGAGKSTTMKMITGFLAPTAGTALICGHDIQQRPLAAKRQFGYLPEGAPAYPDMNVADFLRFIAHIRGFRGAEATARIDHIVELVHLNEVYGQRIETLSKGFRRRVGVAQALIHDPPVVILDEPTDGLDPNQKHEVRGLINALAAEKAIASARYDGGASCGAMPHARLGAPPKSNDNDSVPCCGSKSHVCCDGTPFTRSDCTYGASGAAAGASMRIVGPSGVRTTTRVNSGLPISKARTEGFCG